MGSFGKNRFGLTRRLAAAGLACGLAFTSANTVMAQEEAVPSSVSGTVGVDFYTHFISYGFDVWAAGNDFGENATLNPYAEVAMDLTDSIGIFAGIWGDVNNNAANSIGGDIQEIDVYLGISYGFEEWGFSAVYQEWHYGGGTEHILDFGIGYDDTGVFIDDFAFNPSLTIHNRVAATDGLGGGQEDGTILVFGAEPSFTISEELGLEASVPINVGVSLTDNYFVATGDDGYAYTSIGLGLSMPLDIIPAEYGSWSLNVGLTYYMTEDDVYNPTGAAGNPDDNFLVGNVGISLAF